MVVLVADRIPNKLRGILKLWFIEPKANVFVSNIKNNVAENVIKMLSKEMSNDSGFIFILTDPKNYSKLSIRTIGFPNKFIDNSLGITTIAKYP